MKIKKIIASVLAAVMAVTTMVTAGFTANAANNSNKATYEYIISNATTKTASISFIGATEQVTGIVVKVASSVESEPSKSYSYSPDTTAMNYNPNITISGNITTLAFASELLGYSDDATLALTITVSTNTSLSSADEVSAALESGSICTTDENASAIVLKSFEKAATPDEPVVDDEPIDDSLKVNKATYEYIISNATTKTASISFIGATEQVTGIVVKVASSVESEPSKSYSYSPDTTAMNYNPNITISGNITTLAFASELLGYSDDATLALTITVSTNTSLSSADEVSAALESGSICTTDENASAIVLKSFEKAATPDEPAVDDKPIVPEKPEAPVISAPATPKVPTVSIVPANSAKKFEITDPVTGKAISASVNKLAKALSRITEASEITFNTGDFGIILRKNVIQEIVDNDLTLIIETSKATFVIDAENLVKVKTINIPAIMKTAEFKELVKEGNTFNIIVTEKNKVEIELA